MSRFLLFSVIALLAGCSGSPLLIERSPIFVELEGEVKHAADWFEKSLSTGLQLEPGAVVAHEEGALRLKVEIPTARITEGIAMLGTWSRKPDLAFASVHPSDRSEASEYVGKNPKVVPDGWQVLPFKDRADGFLLVANPTEFDRSAVKSAVPFESQGSPGLSVAFTDEAGEQMGAFTKEHVNEPMAIIVGNEVLSSPVIREPFSSGASIAGNCSEAEVSALAAYLSNPPTFAFSVVPNLPPE